MLQQDTEHRTVEQWKLQDHFLKTWKNLTPDGAETQETWDKQKLTYQEQDRNEKPLKETLWFWWSDCLLKNSLETLEKQLTSQST